MSDPKATPEGEPVVEPVQGDGDVVERVNEGLAEAEAAGRDATESPADATESPADATESPADATESPADAIESPADAPADSAQDEALEAASEPVAEAARADDVPWYDRPLDETPGAEAAPVVVAPVPETSAAAPEAPIDPAPVDSAPVRDTFVAGAAQPIFVQAPEPPRKRGNRGAAGLIGLLAAIAFAVLSFGIIYGYGFLSGQVTSASASEDALDVIRSWVFWLPVVAFFIGFWLLGAVLNRARWPHWVIWGLLVGVAAYGGYLLGVLFQAPFWELTPSEGMSLLDQQLFSPYAIMSFVLGRELTIWFGAWVAARGKRVTALNDEAQREYERTLEAGPQLAQQ